MKYLISRIFCILIFSQAIFSQDILAKEVADAFVGKLIKGNQDLSGYVQAEDLATSQRLGIQYDRILNKFLIQNDIDPQIKRLVLLKRVAFESKIEPLASGYSKIIFTVPSKQYGKTFYFQGDKLISPAKYFTRDWQRVSTPYFDFIISNENDFNPYAVSLLEKFVEEMFVILEISPEDQEKLKAEKIVYVLCHNTDEMEQITGFVYRGFYALSHDQIISTFNCHRHEIAHLLINYKLKQLPLYTHHFLQGKGLHAPLAGAAIKIRK